MWQHVFNVLTHGTLTMWQHVFNVLTHGTLTMWQHVFNVLTHGTLTMWQHVFNVLTHGTLTTGRHRPREDQPHEHTQSLASSRHPPRRHPARQVRCLGLCRQPG